MKALQISRHGAPAEVVELVDIPEPDPPRANEVLVAVEYAPINQSEQLKIMGRYPVLPTSFPAGVGNQGVARVLSVGGDVAGLKPGDRVLVPEYVDLNPGDWVIQNAGNSGVGRSVIAIARSRGLFTVSLVRRPDLVNELIETGAHVVLMDGPDIAARVAKATSNAKIRLAIDGVAGESTASLSSCLAPGGTVVLYSFTSGKPGFANGVDLVFRNTTIRGFWLYSPLFTGSAKIVQGIKLGAQLVAEGKLSVPIAATYPLGSAATALAHAQKGGKVLFQLV